MSHQGLDNWITGGAIEMHSDEEEREYESQFDYEWEPEDREELHEALDRRETLRQREEYAKEHKRQRNARNGERIRLLIPHPFQHDEWRIFGPAPEPGWYYIHCVSDHRTGRCVGIPAIRYRDVFEEVRHESEFEAL